MKIKTLAITLVALVVLSGMGIMTMSSSAEEVDERLNDEHIAPPGPEASWNAKIVNELYTRSTTPAPM